MKEKKIQLLFGVHMHQPVENFDEAIERAVTSCYAPFFATMRRNPAFRFSLHCSGWLLEKIRSDHPDLFADIRALADAGSIEFLTAGYYEPVLSAIPSRDRIAQIERLSGTIGEHFGQRPKGLWLTERVWEQGLIADLVEAGLSYALVDDYHFLAAGFDKERLGGYFFSEEGGDRLALFPICKDLRYAIPFKPVEQAIEAILRTGEEEEGGAAILFDDAEKFGMWPGTHEWVHEKGWLERFVEAVLSHERIETEHYGRYLARNRAKGIAYLPDVSYYEMGEWSLKADDALALERLKRQMGEERFWKEGVKFLKGGIWKNFFVKYDESNRLHKRMVESSKRRIGDPEYLEALYRLQTNDVFWHGVFGGLYLPNLRDNAYRYLIRCENLRYGRNRAVEEADIDMDGYPEAKWVGREVIVRFESRFGGQLVEFCDRKYLFNFQNVLTRRKEAYHEKLRAAASAPTADHEEEGIQTIHNAAHRADESIREALVYDWYVKNSFIDHIGDHTLDLESFRRCSFREFSDFANQPFEMALHDSGVTFVRDGGIYDGGRFPTRLQKAYRFADDGVDFRFDLSSESSHIYEYGIEFNLHFAHPEELLLRGEPFAPSTLHELRSFTLEDPYTGRAVTFETDHFFTLLAVPLETVSQSEEGFERTVQGVSLMAVFPFAGRLSIAGSLKVDDV
ncbi:alpha-amylase/4-alpha-glucanotransferase domain-containing protein [Hydrogenimonas sp.]